jgi:hypothetical protein
LDVAWVSTLAIIPDHDPLDQALNTDALRFVRSLDRLPPHDRQSCVGVQLHLDLPPE